MKQTEIELGVQPMPEQIKCGCLSGKDRGDIVSLRPSLDARFLVGNCSHCNKQHTRKAA